MLLLNKYATLASNIILSYANGNGINVSPTFHDDDTIVINYPIVIILSEGKKSL